MGLVDVHREDGRRAVEHRCERGHDGGRERREGQALEAGRQELQQPWIGVVRVGGGGRLVGCGLSKAGHDPGVLRHHVGGDAGNHDNQRQDELEAGGKQDAALAFLERFGGQRPLDDVLVEAPVVDIGHPHAADEDPDARQVHVLRMPLVQDHGKLVRCRLVDRAEAGPHAASPRHSVEREIGRDEATEDQEDHLDDVGPGHGRQPAVQRIGRREGRQTEHSVDHRNAHDGLQRERAEVQHGGEVDEDVERDPEDRQDRLELRGVPLLDELGNRVEPLLDEDGQEVFADEDQGQRRHPLIRGDGQADFESGAGHADELLGGYVGRDEGGAHRPPGERFAGEEIVLGVFLVALFFAGHPETDPEDEDGIADEDGVVERRERAGHEGVRCWRTRVIDATVRSMYFGHGWGWPAAGTVLHSGRPHP